MVEVAPTLSTASAAPERQKLDWLQCGRAVAALAVCCFHASERVMKHAPDVTGLGLFQFGKLGVDLFFVISGFIICYIHAADIGRPATLGRYVYRRATRIYPLYWLLFVAILPLYFVFPEAGDGAARDLGSVVRCFFLLPNPPSGQIIGVAWTLVFEISFYAVFALLIINRWVGAALIGAWAILITLGVAGVLHPEGYVVPLLSPRYFEFAIGAGVYWASRSWRPKGALLLSACSVVVLFGGGLVSPWFSQALSGLVGQVLLAGGLCGLVVFGLVTARGAAPEASAAGRVLTALGDASYSIYLFHWLIGWVTDKIYLKLVTPSPLGSVIYFAVLIVLMASGGYLVHRVLERPLMRLFAGLWTRHLAPARPRALPAV